MQLLLQATYQYIPHSACRNIETQSWLLNYFLNLLMLQTFVVQNEVPSSTPPFTVGKREPDSLKEVFLPLYHFFFSIRQLNFIIIFNVEYFKHEKQN